MKDGLDQQEPSSTKIAGPVQAPRAAPDTAPVTIIIGGEPVPKGRPRVGRGHIYTPDKTRAYEGMVRQLAALEMRGKMPLQGPVKIELLVELAVPRSWSRTRELAAIAGEIMPASRPDLDNFCKAALDACNGIIIGDDAQIVELRARTKFGGQPKLIMTVTPLNAAVALDRIAEGE
jgi:Holliday junction resolvase RusA-like endonuclease